MSDTSPQPINVRYLRARQLMLAGVILLSLTHLCGFRPTENPSNLPQNWTSITTFIPTVVWVIAWGATLAIGLVELFRGKGRNAISLAVGMCFASAGTYLFSYISTVLSEGWGSREWFYFGLYAGAGLIIAALLAKVGALKYEGGGHNE